LQSALDRNVAGAMLTWIRSIEVCTVRQWEQHFWFGHW